MNYSDCGNAMIRGDNMNPLTDLPMGFGMHLLQNEKAMHRFNAMSKNQQKEIIAQTQLIHSKQEMEIFIDHI
jgi:hypothetical protein